MSEQRPFGRDWTEVVPKSGGYLNSAVVSLLQSQLEGSRILDVGCGNGSLARLIADVGFEVSGVDWDPKAVELASERVPEGFFTVARFNDEPPASSFDAAVSTEVIEHLFDPNELLSFAYKALRPGGVLVISTPYHGYLKNLAISAVNGWDKHFMTDALAGHIKFFSRQTLTEALKRNGFDILQFRGAGRLPLLWKSMIFLARKRS